MTLADQLANEIFAEVEARLLGVVGGVLRRCRDLNIDLDDDFVQIIHTIPWAALEAGGADAGFRAWLMSTLTVDTGALLAPERIFDEDGA